MNAATFDMHAQHLRTVATLIIEANFGERCPENDADCIICKKWAALDELLDNPYTESEGE